MGDVGGTLLNNQCVFQRFAARRPERVLLIGYFDPKGISTVPETLAAIQWNSSFAVTCLNLFNHRHDSGNLKLNPEVDLDAFAVLMVHNSVAYNPANVISLDALTARKFADFPGVKVLFKQDENHRFRETASVIGQMRFDLVLTCLPTSEREKIYPRDVVGADVRFEQMLTGYVTPALRSQFFQGEDTGARSIDIGYRGSLQPLEFGRLCYEKRQIGDEVVRRVSDKDFKLDISSRWEDRFGGDAWFSFLSSCKCILGVESGASIFDLSGDLERRIQAFVEANGPVSEDVAYCESFLDALADLEGNVAYNQISPRHFEAAACGALQIMYPGEYSGIFLPGRHYVALERDFSNLEQALEVAMDPVLRSEMVKRTFDEVILNQEYWIETFVRRLDDAVFELLETKGRLRKANVLVANHACHGLLLAPHRAHLDPRLRWFVDGVPSGMTLALMGLELGGADGASPLAGLPGFLGDQRVLSADRPWLSLMSSMVGTDPAGNAALRELLELECLLAVPDLELCERFGISTSSRRLFDIRWSMRYLLDVTRSLVMPALGVRGLRFVVAADLPTLPAALILKAVLGLKVVFDAHEYWAENDARSEPFEIAFWEAIERRLVPYADRCQVVSPGLAQLLERKTGCKFETVPNCTPVQSPYGWERSGLLAGAPSDSVSANKVRFLFQGLLTPGRGLEDLLKAWRSVPESAQLVLRGPEGEFKDALREMLQDLGLSDHAVVFLPAIGEDELVEGAAGFDVGLVPYPPLNNNNANCCPNKLSQYMAAGLAVLANKTHFVREIVSDAQCGLVVDFGRPDQLVEAVTRLATNHHERAAMASNARRYFDGRFNWGSVSETMYREMLDMCPAGEPEALVAWPQGRYSVYQSEFVEEISSVQISTAASSESILEVAESPAESSTVSSTESVSKAPERNGLTRMFWLVLPESLRRRLRPVVHTILRKGVR